MLLTSLNYPVSAIVTLTQKRVKRSAQNLRAPIKSTTLTSTIIPANTYSWPKVETRLVSFYFTTRVGCTTKTKSFLNQINDEYVRAGSFLVRGRGCRSFDLRILQRTGVLNAYENDFVPCSFVPCSFVLCSFVLCSFVLCSFVLCSFVLGPYLREVQAIVCLLCSFVLCSFLLRSGLLCFVINLPAVQTFIVLLRSGLLRSGLLRSCLHRSCLHRSGLLR